MRYDMADLKQCSEQKSAGAHHSATSKAQQIIREWDETCSVDEVILVLLGLADQLGRDRVRDWDPEKAWSLAQKYVGVFEYETDIHLSSE